MKAFDVYDSSKRSRKTCATLFYDEEADTMSIELSEDARPEDLPLLLATFAEKGVTTIPDKWARRWVEERIPPEGRQNLGEILRANGLDSYDEIALLARAQGRSAQDDFLIRDVTPKYEYAVVSFPEASEKLDADCKVTTGGTWCETLGPKIAQSRKALGLTQRELAERTGIDQAAISRIESGKANPTLDTLDALAEGVGRHLLVQLV
jgi:DNA-binding XRE family transcriptional regulator